jgi:hypothetical protein
MSAFVQWLYRLNGIGDPLESGDRGIKQQNAVES